MSNFGFGFGAGSDDPSGDPDDLASKIPLFAELQKLLSGDSGPVNWDLARQLAISGLASAHKPVTAADTAAVADALRLADLWLDDVTDLPSGVTTTEAWTPVDWVEKTIGTWGALCDPVASRVVAAMGTSLPEEVREQAGAMAPMMAQFGGLIFGAQLGQGLSGLASEVVSATDIGLPLGPAGTGALVVSNLNTLAEDLERPIDEVRLFIAIREAAHHRLFIHVPWLRQQIMEAVDAYGRGIHIDPDVITNALTDIDPSDPASLQNALTGGLFEPQNTDAQNVALRRLETLLALVEGWVDTVVTKAASDRMSGAGALSEAIRRRRAAGGPAEQTFSTLVGLELRPRRLRDAAALWLAMTDHHGVSVRDTLWNHPDLLPTTDDLDDPQSFASSYGTAAELQISDFTDEGTAQKSAPKSETAASDTPSSDTPSSDTPSSDTPSSDTPSSDSAASASDTSAASDTAESNPEASGGSQDDQSGN